MPQNVVSLSKIFVPCNLYVINNVSLSGIPAISLISMRKLDHVWSALSLNMIGKRSSAPFTEIEGMVS